MTITDLFTQRRDKIAFAGPDQCWLWTGRKNDCGYGRLSVDGRDARAHRLAYESVHGPGSADGLVVRHRCDTPACVNPAHLEIGTQADNVRDMNERGRHRGRPPRGEAHGNSKLSAADVVLIRSLHVPGSREFGGVALGRRFGVRHTTINMIVRRRHWTHV